MGGVCPIACWDTPPWYQRQTPLGRSPLGRHPWADTPQADTPEADTPRQTPHQTDIPRQTTPGQIPRADTPSSLPGRHPPPSASWDTVNRRVVRIPLECILTTFFGNLENQQLGLRFSFTFRKAVSPLGDVCDPRGVRWWRRPQDGAT